MPPLDTNLYLAMSILASLLTASFAPKIWERYRTMAPTYFFKQPMSDTVCGLGEHSPVSFFRSSARMTQFVKKLGLKLG
ncbi:hypothetical protein J3E69DRAFT_292770 [Trichoderma sp. SZMC 28015]